MLHHYTPSWGVLWLCVSSLFGNFVESHHHTVALERRIDCSAPLPFACVDLDGSPSQTAVADDVDPQQQSASRKVSGTRWDRCSPACVLFERVIVDSGGRSWAMDA